MGFDERKEILRLAEKDITEKVLESYNDVFADIVNVLLFDGKEIVKEEELVDLSPRSAYKMDGKIREVERDVAKRWTRQKIRIACLGMENQTNADPDMPLRVFQYDAAEYRAQLSGKERYPVVTLVLYFGHEKHWNQPRTLLERIRVPQEFASYVNDYEINLFEIAFLSEEKVKLFKSDFKIVVDYFVQMQKHGRYQPGQEKIHHIQEVLQLLSVMTSDHRFEEIVVDNEEGRPHNMCEVIDRYLNQGRIEGKREGIQQGLAAGEARIMTLMQKLFSAGRISDAQRASVDRDFCEKLLVEFDIN